jgi:hypothetical protein
VTPGLACRPYLCRVSLAGCELRHRLATEGDLRWSATGASSYALCAGCPVGRALALGAPLPAAWPDGEPVERVELSPAAAPPPLPRRTLPPSRKRRGTPWREARR